MSASMMVPGSQVMMAQPTQFSQVAAAPVSYSQVAAAPAAYSQMPSVTYGAPSMTYGAPVTNYASPSPTYTTAPTYTYAAEQPAMMTSPLTYSAAAAPVSTYAQPAFNFNSSQSMIAPQTIVAPFTPSAPVNYLVSGAGYMPPPASSFVAMQAPVGTQAQMARKTIPYSAPAPVAFVPNTMQALPMGGSVVMGSTPSGGEVRVPQDRFQQVVAGNALSQSEILQMTAYPQPELPPMGVPAVIDVVAPVAPAFVEMPAPTPVPVAVAPVSSVNSKKKSSKKKLSSKKKKEKGCC